MAKNRGRLGAHSRVFRRGAVGGTLDARSREGRYLRTYEAALTQHVGGQPSATQRILITRASRLALRLELLDETALAGSSSDHDLRLYSSLNNHLRLVMRELGLRPAAESTAPSLADYLAHRASSEAAT